MTWIPTKSGKRPEREGWVPVIRPVNGRMVETFEWWDMEEGWMEVDVLYWLQTPPLPPPPDPPADAIKMAERDPEDSQLVEAWTKDGLAIRGKWSCPAGALLEDDGDGYACRGYITHWRPAQTETEGAK